MKIGISAFAWTSQFDESHLGLLPWAKEHGFDGLEVTMFDPSDLPVGNMRRVFETNQLECSVCCILPNGVNPISPDADLRKKSILHLKHCIETTAELGARLLGGPVFAPIGYLPEHRPTADEWNWAVEAFQSLGDALDKHEMTLAIEPVNRSETFFLRTALEADKLCKAIGHPRIGVTIDTFHANIEEKDIALAISLLGNRLRHLHASENDRGLLGEGHVDFHAIAKALMNTGYNGYLMIEGFGYSPEEKIGPGVLWADLAVSPEDIALKGADYLRQILAALA